MNGRCQVRLLWLALILLVACRLASAQGQTGSTKPPQQRAPVDIRDPEPDSANFPNSAFTLHKGHLYLENSPVGLMFGAKEIPKESQWQFLIRYGFTDRIELRMFSSGLTVRGKPDQTTGFSPLAFDVKVHLWDEKKQYFIPAVGIETYVQTNLGSEAFDSGTFPAVNLLFDHSLPWKVTFEYNIGTTREKTLSGESTYVMSFPWSFTREVIEDVDIYLQGFYGSLALPRSQGILPLSKKPAAHALGAGALWTLNSRAAVWATYAFGTKAHSPNLVEAGFAVAF